MNMKIVPSIETTIGKLPAGTLPMLQVIVELVAVVTLHASPLTVTLTFTAEIAPAAAKF